MDIKITEKLVFGFSDSLSDASLHAVAGVQTDKSGQIYAADAATSEIKVFSPGGEWLYSFGKRGRGPGEFISIRGFALIDNSIFVWDQDLQRLNVFNLKGKFQTAHTLKGVAAPIKIYPLEGSYLVVYAGFNTSFQKKKLAHIYSEDFSELTSEFLLMGEINDEIDEKAGRFLLAHTGSIQITDDGKRLFFIP